VSADGRFAPSPTGPLHLGSLRTALAAWLFARSAGAHFLLRIEDLDPQRSRREWEALQLADLEALGIDWDGEAMRQSERGELYETAIDRLQEAGHLYPCFCTRAEIREAASAPHGEPSGGAASSGLPEGALPEGAYPGTCRHLSAAERAVRIAAGDRYALRFDAGAQRISFDDRLLGPQSFVVDDFVVRRTDGVTAYQLAVVVDDAAQGIGEVVRGADLVDSTPRQILLARALELSIPKYAHIALVLGPDGARLAKRHGAATMTNRAEPPEATLRLLAQSLGVDAEAPMRAADLLPDFNPERIPRSTVQLT
jgi:glutamyl-tRNA synthetase